MKFSPKPPQAGSASTNCRGRADRGQRGQPGGSFPSLWDILTGHDQTPAFVRRTSAERKAILEILRATKPGLPGYWKAPESQNDGPKTIAISSRARYL